MASLPKTYKAAFIVEIGKPLEVRDVEMKLPAPGEVLVKVLASGMCGSDSILIRFGMHGMQKELPLIPGHEIVGDVVAVGDGVTSIAVGERVGGAWHGGHDGTCSACHRGVFQMCDNEQITGVTRDGGYAEYVSIRQEAAVRLPKDCDPVETAPLLCAGVTTFNSLRQQHITQGTVVAVQGLGALGHLAVQYTQKMGYDVVAISSGDSKREDAAELGAIGYINASAEDPATVLQTKYGGAAAIVCTAPNPAIIPGLVRGLRALGTLLVLAPVSGVEIDLQPFVGRGLKLTGWPSGHADDSAEAVAFAKNHGVKTYIERYKFADVNAALDRLLSGKAHFKVVLDMQ